MISLRKNITAPPKTLESHELADLFPLMEGKEFNDLVENIRAHGQFVPIVLLDGKILDGRNRYNAHLSVGGELLTRQYDANKDGDDPAEFVVAMNLHRRHLTSAQKRDVIAKMLKASPEKSDRRIADAAKADHKTVADVRGGLEDGGEIPHHQTRVGADGVEQPATKPEKTEPVKTAVTDDPEMAAIVAKRAEHAITNGQAPAETEPVKTAPEKTKPNGQASPEIIAAPADMPSLRTAVDALIWHAKRNLYFMRKLPEDVVYPRTDLGMAIDHLRALDKFMIKRRAAKKKAEATMKKEADAAAKAAAKEAKAEAAQKKEAEAAARAAKNADADRWIES
jgi:hypothetical protein